MHKERLILTAIIAALGLMFFGVFRPTSVDPLNDLRVRETWFYINKVHSPVKHDLVIIGDSRALRGVVPSVLGDKLGNIDVLNFAFNAGGLSDDMFKAAEAKLDPESENKSILLAVTPLVFQALKSDNAQYNEYLNKPIDEVFVYTKFTDFARFFQPVSVSVLLKRWFSIVPSILLYPKYNADGWIETTQKPLSTNPRIDLMKKRLIGTIAEPDIIDELMEQIKDWVGSGITVYGFRVPEFAEITSIENNILQFSQISFADNFKKAGGLWIEIPKQEYLFYDGSHLDGKSARKMTASLAEQIAQANKHGGVQNVR
jgi:hypothetical protein